MEDKVNMLKKKFNNIKNMRVEMNELFTDLDGKIVKLKDIYGEFIKNTNLIQTQDKKIFIFSLDSFYFQTSLLNKEYINLKNYSSLIINRMYGEYYKLLKIIYENLQKGLINYIPKSNIDIFPIYDDLNEDKEYDFDLIIQLNEELVNIIYSLLTILNEREVLLKRYRTDQDYGLNVDNFVSTYNYEVLVLTEQINLYEKYLLFFYSAHEKLLTRLITQISLVDAQLNNDIKFEDGLLTKKRDNRTIFDSINLSTLDKITAKELRKSVGNSSPVEGNDSDSSYEYFENSTIDLSNNFKNKVYLKKVEKENISLENSNNDIPLETENDDIPLETENDDIPLDTENDDIPLDTENDESKIVNNILFNMQNKIVEKIDTT